MEDLLTRRFAIGEKQVDPFTRKAGRPEGRGHPRSQSGDVGEEAVVEIRKHHDVVVGDDQQMTRRDRSVIEEGRDSVVSIDEAGRGPPGHDVAEDAAGQSRAKQAWL